MLNKDRYKEELGVIAAAINDAVHLNRERLKFDMYTELVKCGVISPKQYGEIMQGFGISFTPEIPEIEEL